MLQIVFRINGGGLLLLALTCVVAAPAQSSKARSKPNFSGEWLLDLKKTDKASLPGKSVSNLPIKISHRDPEFRVTQTLEVDGKLVDQEYLYFTDERGEKHRGPRLLTPGLGWPTDANKPMVESRTHWAGEKIVTVSAHQTLFAQKRIEYTLYDEWKLSRDGKVLTRVSSIMLREVWPFGNFAPVKRIYKRI
jgi:hypothetical protein